MHLGKEQIYKDIYSFNANGLGEKNKRKAILNWIKTHHHGVLFLQETHSVEKSEEVWKQELIVTIFTFHMEPLYLDVLALLYLEISMFKYSTK